MKPSDSSLFLVLVLAITTGGHASPKNLRRSTRSKATPRKLLEDKMGCAPDSPCDECQGDCDTDFDCAAGLFCYQKDLAFTAEAAAVPGCEGLSFSRTDYCVAPLVEEPVEPAVEPVEPVGFDPGMAAEIAGLWVGEEKYTDGFMVYDYCSKALFSPSENGNYLTWHGYYLGNSSETCEDMGVDPKEGSVNNEDYFTDIFYPEESYVLRLDYKSCLVAPDCSYDVTTSEGYEDYEVVASSCGAHLKEDLLNAYFSCELYQVNKVQKKDGTGDPLDVVILTYTSYYGGYGNFSCPGKPTYDLEEFVADPVAEGTARFVLQSSYGEGVNSSDWECLV